MACSLAAATAVTYGPIQGQVSPMYPAGIDPNTCPNFPYCANPLVTVSQRIKEDTHEEKEETPQLELSSPYQISPPKPPQHQVYPGYQAASRYVLPRYHIKLVRPPNSQPQVAHQGPRVAQLAKVTPLRVTVPFNPFLGSQFQAPHFPFGHLQKPNPYSPAINYQTPQIKYTPPVNSQKEDAQYQITPSKENSHPNVPQYRLNPQYRLPLQPKLLPHNTPIYQPKYTDTSKAHEPHQPHQYLVKEPESRGLLFQEEEQGIKENPNSGKVIIELSKESPRSSDFGEAYTPEEQRALDIGEYIGDGDYHGEGLDEGFGGK
ncbi:hypothetical protein NQ318_008606 [Aromia moschata]|uniref:Cuticle protein CPCFC domain-containing protein n=1 Tax=Aromia moschata TaxID=1265417 RepID=A0AAV8YX25_9CUCU|nr:hypothetical protein NQ318_008606 [Aromia moschata]